MSNVRQVRPWDDKKLVDTFSRVIKYGATEEGKIADNRAQFSKDFIICLLRTRYLFDKFIVKREYANENSDGEWSLKSLDVSGQQTRKKPYYRNSSFVRFREWGSTNDWRAKTNIMLQSAPCVSYTSPKVMHWITQLLLWLSEDNYKHTVLSPDDMAEYSEAIETIAKKAVTENFFNVCKDGTYCYDMENFRVEVDVVVSNVFFSWVFGFGGDVVINGPADVKEQYKEMVLKVAEKITSSLQRYH